MVRVGCPDCGTVTEKDTEAEAFDTADRHNEMQHDGDEVAGVFKDDVQTPGEMLETAKENMSDEEWLNFLVILGQNDPMNVRG